MKSLEVRQLTFDRSAGGFRFGPVTFDVPSGARVALVGPSGSGKSTLLRLLAGLEHPTSGSIRIGDRECSSAGRIEPPDTRRIGYVFQSSALWPHMTALQHVRFAGPKMSKAAALELLESVGLGTTLTQRRPGAMSGGEGQRLALARALAGEPELLLLDEPLRSVDVHLRDELATLIRRVARERGLTLVVVTHDRDEALAIADQMIVLHDGQIIESGSQIDILKQPKTAFAAGFLARATCLAPEPTNNGQVVTPFGSFPTPSAVADAQSLRLVLLPGDVTIAPDQQGDLPRGLVAHIEPSPLGDVANIEFANHTLQVAATPTLRVGDEVGLRLCGEPRLLPLHQPTDGPMTAATHAEESR